MPKNTSPKVKALMHRFSVQNANKAHRKFILSVKYVMAHCPRPCVNLRSISAKPHTWPKQVALTGGRTLSPQEVMDITVKAITRANPNRTDLQYSVQTFLKALKPYLPSGILINSDWANLRIRQTDPKCIEVADEFEEWVTGWYNDVEAELASMYLNAGDRNGAQYFKVLERRFRANWSQSFQVNSKSEVKADVKADVKSKVDATVNFNFSVAESNRVPPVGG